jgi:tripartite-type tricarboxylate transporter receptor subunit TctC
MSTKLLPALSRALLSAVVALSIGAEARAEDDFLKDKIVTVYSPSPPGGSFHLYCDVVARNIAKYLPGEPTVIVNHRPGGGGVLASWMTNVAPTDGTVIAMISPGAVTDALVRNLKFDATKFRWLGSPASRAHIVTLWHTAPVEAVEDLKKAEIVVGASSRSDATYMVPAVVNAVLGARLKIVSGYAGGGAINLAMAQGEVMGRSNYYSGFASVRPDWIDEKKIRFMLSVGPDVPELPTLPNLRQFVKAGSPGSRLLDLVEVNFVIGQGFYVPPGMTDDRFKIMRGAFERMLKDPAAIAMFKERKLDFRPISGEKIEELIETQVKTADPAAVKALATIMGVKS